MRHLKLLAFAFALMAAVVSCSQTELNEFQETEAGLQELDPNRSPGTLLCTLDCPYGGFQIKVYEIQPGVHRYSYYPRTTIYVDAAYHSANHPNSPTSNPYTFDYFLFYNTNNSPSCPYKDINGDVILGNVYVYRLKNPQCQTYFYTNALYGLTNPCDMNSALLHLNQSNRKPASNCGNPSIVCPAPPISSIPYVSHKPIKIPPSFNVFYGYDCTDSTSGICMLPKFPEPAQVHNPGLGPVWFEYEGESHSMEVSFWRDLETEVLEIFGSNTLLDESLIQYFQFEPGTKFMEGEYEVYENDYGFTSVMLPIEN